MNINASRLNQHSILINAVRRKGGCKLTDIQQAFSSLDLWLTRRTFFRIKKELQEIGIDIQYEHDVYILDEDDKMDQKIEEMFTLVNYLGDVKESFDDLKEMQKHIRISSASTSGKGFIQSILKACVNKQYVRFDHHSYQRGSSKAYKLAPYQVKEYEGRWYIVGAIEMEKGTELRSFGLDRVKNLEVLKDTFNTVENLDPDEYYSMRIGMWGTAGAAPMEVKLKVDSLNWNWINSNPIHKTQEVIEKTDSYVIFTLFVIPGISLQRAVMAWAPDVEVLSPESLRKQYLEIYRKGYKAHRT